MREHIAHLAARLMAVDGIDDYALAKRKAARQLGAPDTRNLPNDEEIEQALRAYQQIFQANEHRERLQFMRRRAREMMDLLARFDPWLSGAVLSGIAGKYSEIELLLFTDSVKDVELFLLDRRIEYSSTERRIRIGDETRGVPNFHIQAEDVDFDVSVLAPRDRRSHIRNSHSGRPLELVRVDKVDTLLATGTT